MKESEKSLGLLYLLHGCWEKHLLPFGTTFIFITISGIIGSHWARVRWLWDWNGSCQQKASFWPFFVLEILLVLLKNVHYRSGVK